MTFQEFNFQESLQEGLNAMGFHTATPVQQQAIPVIMQGRDLIACAQTGTGKTAAYLLPVMHQIKSTNSSALNTLILAPTRELAIQIDQQIEALGYFTGISSIAIYGGGDGIAFEQQKRALTMGADIIIATPGRLLSLISQNDLDLTSLKHLILDEADRMLDMGFYDDIMRVLSYLPKQRQTLLFSATMSPKIRQMAERILTNPAEITIAISKPAEGILQQAYMAYPSQKMALLRKVVLEKDYRSIICFCSTKENVKKLFNELKRTKITVQAFHSDLEQHEREAILQQFKNRQLQMIVATDILSRGIDVDGIDLVVNYDVPAEPEDYIHRIGRTARAESTGTAITFISDQDQHRFNRIEKLINREVPKLPLPDGLGEAPVYNPFKKRLFSGAKPTGKSAGSKKRASNGNKSKPKK